MRQVVLLCSLLHLSVVAGCQQPTSSGSPTPAPQASAPPAVVTSAASSEIITTPSGLKYQDLVVGTGPRPLLNQTVRVLYTGWLENGTKFDSNTSGGKPPLEFKIGAEKGMIKGFQLGVGGGEGIEPMRVGGKRRLIIPPQLGYGAQAYSTIPPNSTLIFEVELIGIQKGGGFGAR